MNIKRIFIKGLIFLLPTLLTIFVIVVVFKFFKIYANFIGITTLFILSETTGLSIEKDYAGTLALLIGFPLGLVIILIVGYLVATFIGRRIFHTIEKYVFQRFPLVGFIYPYAKEFTDILWNQNKTAEFKAVVAVQYPRQGTYAVGFVTSEGIKYLKHTPDTNKKLITVFLPNSPNPFTGYTIFVQEDEVIKLDMTVDEAIRFVVSGGILTPDGARSKEVIPPVPGSRPENPSGSEGLGKPPSQ